MTGKIPPNLPLSREELQGHGFLRVERDDRLFDVFPHLTREHGVEVWEKWTPDTVELILIHFQNPRSQPERLSVPRAKLESKLLKYQRM